MVSSKSIKLCPSVTLRAIAQIDFPKCLPSPCSYSFPVREHIFLMQFIISFFGFAFLSKSELMCSDVEAAASPEELLSKPQKSQART